MAFRRGKKLAGDPGRDPTLPKPHPWVNRGDRRFDTSQLHVLGGDGSRATEYVHRDYLAHFTRWQHAVRFLRPGMRVLDVGCGQDQAMARVACHSLAHVPERYVGVDLNPIRKKTKIAWATVLDEFDFTSRWRELRAHSPRGFDLISCFEVIEHMAKPDGRRLLAGARDLLARDGIFLLSTPVYNEKHMASAHIHEYRHAELSAEVSRAGFLVDRVVGTFMTSQALKRVGSTEHRALAERLHQLWHSWELLACVFAPLYPEASSNCCWVLRRAGR